jgi:leucyl aminopeptidase
MKSPIRIQVKAIQAEVFKIKTDILAVGVLEQKALSGPAKLLDKRLNGAISALIKLGDFEGKEKTTAMLYTHAKLGAARVLLIGLGKKEKTDAETLRKAAATAASKAVDAKAARLCVCLHQEINPIQPAAAAQAMTEGLYFGAYRYDEYLSADDTDKKNPAGIDAVIADTSAAFISAAKKGLAAGAIIGNSQNFARTLANRPASVASPKILASEATKIARRAKLRCTVLDEKKMAAKKMGGILAVGQGSANKPRLIILEYRPAKMTKNTPTIGLVGKAITFDSGGISIKPSEGMQDMKFDKSGGVAVLGAMQAIAQLKPKVRVLGFVPSAENMPSGLAYRPGDIVTTYSGKTVEIHSTDAEGRMILCDAITYAEELGCRTIVDVATLTGACVVALGQKRAGVMGNDEKLVEQLKDAAKKTGERIWHLPCDDEFIEAMKSKIADFKNTGGRWGGACTAAAFLSQFVKKAKWAHLDIAGVGVWGADETTAPGSVGFGVRLLTAFVMNL